MRDMEATTAHTTGRTIHGQTLLAQMGRMNVLAISGGRANRISESTIEFPVANCWVVLVTLDANDTYRVERATKRSGRYNIKATASNVYAEQVGEIAYRASCYHDGFAVAS